MTIYVPILNLGYINKLTLIQSPLIVELVYMFVMLGHVRNYFLLSYSVILIINHGVNGKTIFSTVISFSIYQSKQIHHTNLYLLVVLYKAYFNSFSDNIYI